MHLYRNILSGVYLALQMVVTHADISGNETAHPFKKPRGEKNEFIYLIYAHFHFSTVYESLLQFALICGHFSSLPTLQ